MREPFDPAGDDRPRPTLWDRVVTDMTTKWSTYDEGTLLHHLLTGLVLIALVSIGIVVGGLAVILLMLVGRALHLG